MKTRRFIAVAMLLLIILSVLAPAGAEKDKAKWRDQADHNRWTNAMIFGNESYKSYKPKDIRQAVEQLDDAVLLCLDQFNGSYIDKLSKLNQATIPWIPSDISAIDFKGSSKTHRVYTHRGWNHKYTQTEIDFGHSDVRKQLLYSVVNHVFKFDSLGLSELTAKKKCNAMCSLLYVTHILGDRYHSAQYYGAFQGLLLAGDGESVIYDLTQSIQTLIPRNQCSALIMKLESLSAEIARDERNLANEELLEVDSNYAKELKELLKESLPELLLKQSWFSAVFNPKWDCR